MISNSSIKNYFIQDQIVQNQVQFKINKYHHRSISHENQIKQLRLKKKKQTSVQEQQLQCEKLHNESQKKQQQ